MRTRRRGLRPIVAELEDRCLLSGPPGLTPADITAAYGLGGLTYKDASGTRVPADGSGVTIALIEMYHDPNLASDLHTFDQRFGLPDPTLNVIGQAGSQTDIGWGQEESLDVEWAHAIAPGASLLVIEAAPGYTGMQDIQNLTAAVQLAGAPSTASGLNIPPVGVVSMSWGFREFPGETGYDSSFTTPGITYIAASGDSPGAEYPAASPDVLAVGGTSLFLGVLGGYGSETAWYNSGGGYSQFEAEPAYQDPVQATGQRSVPDVAFVGDPSTGASVYYTPPAGGAHGTSGSVPGSWYTVGGTSLGAPSWAGIIAIVDQGRALAGHPNLSGATQTLPTLYALASGGTTAGDFHAIAPSSSATPWNGGGGFVWGGFGGTDGGGDTSTGLGSTAGATANTQTGLGTPDGAALILDLVGSTLTAPLPGTVPGPLPTPTLSPPSIPAPGPTPSPTLPAGRHHHRHRPNHRPAGRKGHAAASHSRRPVRQGHPIAKGHSTSKHSGGAVANRATPGDGSRMSP